MSNRNQLLTGGNKPVAHIGRNGFDNQASSVFGMRPAVIRPVFFQHTVPNSAFKINATDIVRTTALQKAAFLRGKQELDFFFIPYSQLQSNSNDIILGRSELHPGIFSANNIRSVSIAYLLQCAILPYIYYRYIKYFLPQDGQGDYPNSPFQFEQLNIAFKLLISGNNTNYKQLYSLFYYVDPVFGTATDAEDPTIDVSQFSFVGSDCLHLLASCGYGDYYLTWKNIIDTSFISNPVAPAGWLQSVFNVLRTFLNEIDSTYDSSFTIMSGGKKMHNVLNLVSYQKVFLDIYRDSIVDNNFIYYYASNTDSQELFGPIVNSSDASINLTYTNPLLSYLRPRLRKFKNDLSVGLYPDAQYGEIASSEDLEFNVYDGINVNPEIRSVANSAYSMKFAFALQKYKEMLLRAGSRTKDLLNAQFGVKSHYIEDRYVKYLGSFSGSLDLNKVNATAETGDYSVGDLAANIFTSLQGDEINFTCNDYGIIIGCLSFIIDPLHNAFGFDPMTIKSTQFDFYHEAFANMGLQPVSSSLFSPYIHDDAQDKFVCGEKTLGFAARDIEYKMHQDFAYDNFCSVPLISDSLRINIQTEFLTPLADSSLNNSGSDNNYVVVKDTVQSLSDLQDRVYQLPNCMDSIFKFRDDADADYHHFDVALQVMCDSILPMPVVGLM